MIDEHHKAHELLWQQCAEVPKFRVQLGENRDEMRRVMYEQDMVGKAGWLAPNQPKAASGGAPGAGKPGSPGAPGGSPLRMMESLSGRHQAPDNMMLVRNGTAAIETDMEEEEEAEDGTQSDIPPGVWLIHPSHPTKVKWDIFVGVLIFYSVVSVPFRIGFNIEADGGWYYFDWVVDFTFGIDILLTFFTASFNLDGDLIASPIKVKVNYFFSRGFWIDFLSTMPWHVGGYSRWPFC